MSCAPRVCPQATSGLSNAGRTPFAKWLLLERAPSRYIPLALMRLPRLRSIVFVYAKHQGADTTVKPLYEEQQQDMAQPQGRPRGAMRT